MTTDRLPALTSSLQFVIGSYLARYPQERLPWQVLKTLGACPDGLKRYREEFPDGIRWCREDVARAYNAGLDVWWFVRVFFPPVYTKAWRTGRCALDWLLEEFFGEEEAP